MKPPSDDTFITLSLKHKLCTGYVILNDEFLVLTNVSRYNLHKDYIQVPYDQIFISTEGLRVQCFSSIDPLL